MTAEQDYTLQEALQQLFDQQRSLSDGLLRVHGEVRALKLVLDAVIESHPDPVHLHALWQRVLPDVTDGLIASDSRTSDAQREGWKSVLQHYSQFFELLSQRARRPD